MRLTICSDAHTDKSTSGFDRFDDVAQALTQTVDAAIESKSDAWCFLGDLCDPEDGYEVVRANELMVGLLVRLVSHRVRGILISGNHDCYENASGRTTLSPLRRLGGGVRVFEEPGFIMIGDVALVLLPYSPVSRPYDMVEYLRTLDLGRTAHATRTGVVLGHATHVEGGRQGEETLEMPRGRSVPLPMEEIPLGWAVFNGHYHTPQTTPSGVHIPGSLACLTHGESHTPRFLTVEV